MIFFESAHRIHETLLQAAAVFGERQASVSRELTKKFEETVRGTLSELADWAQVEPKGELVLCIAGSTEEQTQDLSQLVEVVEALKLSGKSLKESVALIAGIAGVSKSDLYDQTIASRAE